jgi:hypothetical protein
MLDRNRDRKTFFGRNKMKKMLKIALVTSVLTLLVGGTAMAFHGGGVAHCDGCHSMHNSTDNAIEGAANAALLKGSDASSTCLNCHGKAGGYGVASPSGTNVNAGGDFYWMTAGSQYSYLVRGNPASNDPDNNGHNIVATDFSFTADANPNNATAPGGTYAAADLGCSSCHDPHGQVDGGTGNGAAAISVSGSYGAADPTDGSIHGNYRLLGDVGFNDFTNDVPVATADGSTGKFVDYGTGMSEWCANCHGDLLVSDSSTGKHPSGDSVKLGAFVANYNSYVASGDFTGDVSTAFDALVPFERDIADGSLLDNASTVGADASSNVMCLSCHRAHGSAFENALRWDATVEFIAETPVIDASTTYVDGSDATLKAAYYAGGATVDIATTYGEWQRSMCNKCHVKD